jgi:hypothetical protein
VSRAISKPIDGARIPLQEHEVVTWTMARATALADGRAHDDAEACAEADALILARRSDRIS